MERNRLTAPVGVLLAGTMLAGCGSMPERHDALEEARSLVQTLEGQPVADRLARDQLAQARAALQAADESLGERRAEDDVDYYAYVALRNAQIVEQLVEAQDARDELEQAEAERTRVLLQARERDAQLAERDARQAQAAAEQATTTAEERAVALERASEQAQAERERAAQLEAELAELQAEQTERGLVLTLDAVLFEVDRAQLQPGAMPMLDRLVRFLEEYPDRRIIIEGHTDSTGPAEYNARLSQERGEAVRMALIERNIAGDRVEVRGLGEDYPVATNDTTAGRQLNRRVEIVISDETGEFAREAERTVRAAPLRDREG